MRTRRHESGQALMEWALLLPLYVILFIGILAIGQRFLIRQQLIMAVRQAAFLYSSGRLQRTEVQQYVRQSLLSGYPHLDIPLENIQVGRFQGSHASQYQLDLCTIDFQPRYALFRVFTKQMEESCVIKHAPPYYSLLVFDWGPPVPW